MTHHIPLAERLRPQLLNDVVGQSHLTGPQGVLRLMIEKGSLPSLIFWGPPGTGKTTMARIISREVKREFFQLSAIQAGVKEVREIIQRARMYKGAILFIDEIHRFNKSQQDALLHAVEDGTITLIGATTENPSFEVNPALLSRCQVYTLNGLTETDMLNLVERALKQDVSLSKISVDVKETEALFNLSGGDARRLLNLLDMVVSSSGANEKVVITNEIVTRLAQTKLARYEKGGELHYDLVSAFIKSVRGSDPNAAVYYLVRMLAGGEDPKFIARRLIILASEDIGNANPTGLVLATNCFQAVTMIGMPEAEIILSQCTTYLASTAKSNASYAALRKAQQLVKKTGDLPVPLHLRNAPTQLMKSMNYGKDYQYAHDYEHNFVEQEFLPDGIAKTALYEPGNNPREAEFRKQLKKLWGDKYGY
uniref:Replication-associated recombination protein A n=1 Tax=Roseihalotalea indica TaxID=2867963 RepID=A0AA49GK94_9BACT|nr:replication-associated recombination protein A [Tunicatimonas sp. TK19036]